MVTKEDMYKRWLYLEPILCNDDGELGVKFRKVDQGFKQVARILESDPRLSALLQSTRLQPMLDTISDQLNACQSALNQYIDEKRSIFPRLYFLSDDDLLELLGQARDGAEGREAVMQSHLKKLFPGVTRVRLGPAGLSITALCSQYDETFQLDHPVDIDCSVEVWLRNLEHEIRSSLRNMTLKCLVANSLREQDPFSLPTQILCLAQNIRFTEQTERAIASKELHKLKDSIEKENAYYSEAEIEDESDKVKRRALILQCSYYIYILQCLIESNTVSAKDWLWQKQLRFYLLNNKEVVARMGLAQISYSYEYLGVNTGQFVRTETTDESFLILTQSLHLGLVGNPFGPAGTGKTESVKALGGLVGRLVLIFNCDEAMDAESMGRLLTGVALCGAWGCFDEFNRLSAATLAAVSRQLSCLLAALVAARENKDGKATAVLNGKQVSVSEWCGVAATLNPAGRGYGGRRELPAALQHLLRPLAMSAPPRRPLASRLLAAHGARCPDQLAADLDDVFTLSSTLLSGQRHYDWGLRALKAAVGSYGAAMMRNITPEQQRALMRKVLRLNNLSKLTHHDVKRFESILSLVFANVPEEHSQVDPMYSALETAVANLGLVNNKLQIQKCMELLEQLQQRMGVVIVGPPGSGKTTIRHILKTALTAQGRSIMEYVINPKAMSRSELLGHIEPDTRQWSDGVISATALQVANQPNDVWSWLVFDGDIDPEWIEALNSVLDDNRLLTLASGWRVQFGANVNCVFETHGLEHASPATVSRMGVILLSDESNCSQEVLEKWIQKTEFENETARLALPLLNDAVKKCLRWIQDNRSEVVVKECNMSLMKQILTQFEYLAQNEIKTMQAEDLVNLAVQRSICGLLKQNAIHRFYEELQIPELIASPITTIITNEWTEGLLRTERISSCETILRAAVLCGTNMLIIGPGSCAKNILTEAVLKESNSTIVTINCTPILEPTDIIAELKRKNVAGAGRGGAGDAGRGACLLVRRLHRARVDQWGSSTVHNFLLQLIQQGGFWSREEGGPQWVRAGRVRVVATASQATLAPRLAAALTPVVLPDPEEEELLELLRSYLTDNIAKAASENEITTLARNILSLYKELSETFVSRPHYKWNPSHLRKWCENIKWYAPSNIAEVQMAINAEAEMIFKERLETNNEKLLYQSIARKYIKIDNAETFFKSKLRGDGVYLESVDYNEWRQSTQKLINQCLTDNENIFGECGIEVCRELSIFCSAITLACNGGVAALVSGAGAGRLAAAQLVCASISAAIFIADQKAHFYNNFKNALASSGEGTRTLLVLCEFVANEDLLGYVETFLVADSIHSVPNKIVPSMGQTQQTQQSFMNMKQNLGIVICLDKDQDNLSQLLETYPLLYNSSRLCWLSAWSSETLRGMPTLVIQRLMKESAIEMSNEDIQSIPVEGLVGIHESMQSQWLLAPCRYVQFLKAYYHIVSTKKDALIQRKNMLSSGVEALRRARSEVSKLQAEAAEQEAALSEKQAAANSALEQISATVRATTDRKQEMHQLKINIEAENEKLQVRKKEIEDELASVEPVIAEARAAVGDIRPESLSEIRSLRAPPDVVRDVLEGVLRLMGIADTSWHSMKSFLSKRGVKEDIRCLDASQISPEAAQSVERLLEKRGSSFEAAVARRASAACAPLAAWVRANLAYARALARVRPLQEQQRQLHKNLKQAEDELAALSTGLATVDERVGALKEQLGQHTREAAALELRLSTATGSIRAASDLLRQLAGEYDAWQRDLEALSTLLATVDEQVGALKEHLGEYTREAAALVLRLSTAAGSMRAASDLLRQLAGEYDAWQRDLEHISKEILELNERSLLAAGYLIYLSDLTEPQARNYLTKWCSVVGFEGDSYSVINFLSTPEKQLKWEADGLPLDQSAIKNAVLIDQFMESSSFSLIPLVIDPEGEAVTWLRKTLSESSCDFVSQHSDKLQTALQFSIRMNRILVITEVEQIDEWWWSAVSAGRLRAIIVTCEPALVNRLSPSQRARLTTLYFTARLHALVDQLVNYAMQKQNPEMNEKSKEIKLKKATLQKQQHELQENLLRDLSSNSDILHDANLLASLNKTRATSTTISEALQAAKAIEEETRIACETYGESALRTAQLTLSVKQLTVQRPLVALPMDTILDVFVEAVRRTGNNPKNINNDNVTKYVTRRVIERVLLSVHKKDKYVVIMHLLREVFDNFIPEQLWQLYVGNFNLLIEKDVIIEIKKQYEWIGEEYAKNVAQIKLQDENLFSQLQLNKSEMWLEFQKSGDLNVLDGLNLTPFQKIVAVAALRPESSYRAIVEFVDQVLGGGSVTSGEAVAKGVRWSSRARPVLLLAAHATDVLAAHAQANSLTLTTVGVEEGRGAWEAALQTSRGGWLAVVVGASPFTRELLNFLAELPQRAAEELSEEFRLWIVAEEREIPSMVSTMCVNVILEAPEGVKRNVCGTLQAWARVRGDAGLLRLLACLALFHALVQERRAYIPQGWSQWYAWEWGEVSASAACARACLTAGGDASGAGGWAAARELCGALYGARVGDARDRRLLRALLLSVVHDAARTASWRPPALPAPLPMADDMQTYISAFERLPDVDSPQLLQLPDNCRAARDGHAARALLAGLRELSTTATNIRSNVTSPLKNLLSLWKKLMAGSPLIKADYHIPNSVGGWWGAVCAGEVMDAAAATRALHCYLARLAQQPHGAHAHALHKVPDEWQLLWLGPETPEDYIKEFCHRARSAVERLKDTFDDEYMPKEVDLRSFLRGERVLTALRARAAARLARPAYSLALAADWGRDDATSNESLVVRGLRLSGGVWAAGALHACAATSAPHARAPPLLLRAVPQDESSREADESSEVVIYTSAARNERVGSVAASRAAHLPPRTALLHALALYVAPLH